VPGETPATIRGGLTQCPEAYQNRFSASTTYGANGFSLLSQEKGQTIIDDKGYTAVRVNVPPIGFNKVRIQFKLEKMAEPAKLIDMEVPAVVVIDPGHGGKDPGAIAPTDTTVKEADLALAYGKALYADMLSKFQAEKSNYRVYMTRKTDKWIKNSERAKLAKNVGADVFVSVHFNHLSDASVRGTEYVTRSTGQVNATEDALLGQAVQSATLAAVKASDPDGKHRDPKSGPFAVLSDTHYGNTEDYHPIRGTIIEVEFLTNVEALESIKLSGIKGQAIKTKFAKDVAQVIYNNIINHK
jgi:N-acetylmuramoyl-L-alanine amidase